MRQPLLQHYDNDPTQPVRSWPDTAAEYRRRHGGKMSRSLAQKIGLLAIKRIRRHLAEFRDLVK